MKALELFFNTEETNEYYETWCFEADKEDQDLGNLYVAGHLKSKDRDFMNDLAYVTSETYYSSEKNNFKKAVEKANSKIKERGLPKGKLNFVIFNLRENLSFRFTKIGSFNIIIVGERIIDLSEEIDDYDSFRNMVSGNLKRNSKVVITNEEIWKKVKNKNLVSKIKSTSSLKKIKNILETEEVSGISLVIIPKRKRFKFLRKIIPRLSWFKSRSPLPKFKKAGLPKKPNFKKFKLPSPSKYKKMLTLTVLLVALIATGSFIFQDQQQERINKINKELDSIQQQVKKAESLMEEGKRKEASRSLKESLEKVGPITNIDLPVQEEAKSIRQRIKENLFTINNLEKIDNPELIKEIDPENIVPKRILGYNAKLYVFSHRQENIYQINEELKEIQLPYKFNDATLFQDGILFFSDADSVVFYKNNETKEIEVISPYSNFQFGDLSSFGASFYLLDRKNGEILKGGLPFNEKSQDLKPWLTEEESVQNASSFAIDGSIWILKNNKVQKYYTGKHEKDLKLDLFPKLERGTEIYTRSGLPYLYVLEPSKNRVIILDKEGKVVKQFQSGKFNLIKDFAVSNTGKTIYLLSGQKIYKISF